MVTLTRASPISFYHAVIFLVLLTSSSSQAYEFHVGGKRGWGLKPSKRYKDWASKTRFQLGDSLVFRYKNGTDSVLVVDEDDYTRCDKSSPIRTLQNDGEHSKFDLEHWGLFYFISGKADNCNKGEKIAILVIAPRDHSPHNSPAPSPTPTVDNFPPSLSPSPTAMAPGPASGSAPVGHSGALLFCFLSVAFVLLG
ncbi:Phytocyanin domain-containing protein [Heracleum sosnowskyi]|uniref:Phytocyanin domain-containing protein n=1 Tax=Heracleum sosnowskyi TaxID=360622 RepID=A0AAD8MXN9_9APIA|nr:Phytocyanin domain-containing protein [Heracleum sosnowskyi]